MLMDVTAIVIGAATALRMYVIVTVLEAPEVVHLFNRLGYTLHLVPCMGHPNANAAKYFIIASFV